MSIFDEIKSKPCDKCKERPRANGIQMDVAIGFCVDHMAYLCNECTEELEKWLKTPSE